MPRNPAPEPKTSKPKAEPKQIKVLPPAPSSPPAPPALPVKVVERRIETVIVEIPLGEPPHRFRQIHLEALLYKEHAQTFARLRQALRDKNAKTADGKEVRSGPDILRWLLEQFALC